MSGLRPLSPPSGEPGEQHGWPRAGWYPDPALSTQVRFWDGSAWTQRVAAARGATELDLSTRLRFWDGSAWTRHVAVARGATELDESALRHELGTFVDHLHGCGVDDPRIAAAVPAYAAERSRRDWELGEAPLPMRASPPPASARWHDAASARPTALEPLPPPLARPQPEPTLVAPDRVAPPCRPSVAPRPRPQRVGRPARWPEQPLPAPVAQPPSGPSLWDRVRNAVVSDLAVHGLAYLGVLLVFAGIFGLLVFSWGEVGSGLQPVAELAVPVALLGAGAVLTRRGSHLVGRALTLVGGAVVPLVAIASVADGSAFPPDAHRGALVACAATAFFGTAAVYAVVSARRPDSPLRYLVAPALWLGAGMVALAARSDQVIGGGVAEPSSGQIAVILVAIAAIAWLARLRPDHHLARPTLVVSVAGLAVFGLLAIVLGAAETWPSVALVVAALAVAVGLEAVAPLLPDVVVGVGQVVGTVGAIAAIGIDVEPAWAAVVGVVALTALLEWEGARRPGDVTLASAGASIAVALAVTLVEPWASVAGFAIAAVWAAHVDVTTRTWLSSRVGELLAGLLPIGVVVGLFRAIDVGVAATITAAGVAAIAVSTRASRVDEPLLRRWVPAASIVVVVLPLMLASVAAPGWLAATSALAVIAVVAAPLPVVSRIWLASVALVEVGAFLSIEVGVRAEWSAVLLAAAGALAIVAAAPRLVYAGHVGLIGHLATVVAVAVAAAALGEWWGWPATICLVLFTFGLSVTSWYQERGGAPAVELLVERMAVVGADGELVRAGVPALAVASIPPAVVSAAVSAGVVAEDPVRVGVVLAVVGAALAALTWPAHRMRRIAAPSELVGVISGVTGVVLAAAQPVPATVAGALLATSCLVPHPSVRWMPLNWLGWATTGFTVVTAADAFGLPADRWCLALLGWAAVVVVGSLAADRLIAGPRSSLGWTRVPALLAPATLAAVAIPVGLLPTYGLDTATWAWSSVAVAAVAAVVAWLTQIGAISGLAWVLVSVGAGGLAPFDPIDHPPVFVVAASVMAAAAFVIERAAPRTGWASWDLPPLVVGAGVALVGVAVAVPDAVAWTWLAAGALALAVAAWRREPGWAVAGVALVNGAAVDAGRGWLTISLAATSIGATVRAAFTRGRARVVLQITGAVAAVGAVEAFMLRAGWIEADPEVVASTGAVAVAALLGGGLAAALGGAARWFGLSCDWVVAWSPAALVLLAQAALSVPDGERLPSGMVLAIGLTLAAAGAALAARPLDVAVLREWASVLVLLATASTAWALDARPVGVVAAASAIAVTTAGVGVWLVSARPGTPWLRPLDLVTGVSAITAVVVAAGLLPQRGPMVAALLVVAAVSAALGVTRRLVLLQVAVPLLLCSAWLIYASEALRGEPLWFTMPIGLALLGVAAIGRHRHRQLGGHGTPAQFVAIEITAFGALLLPPMVAMVADHLAYSLVAILTGAAIAAWGVITEVRRRLAAGAIAVVVTVVLLIGVPLVDRLSGLRPTGAALWLLLLGIGVVAIALAAALERGRTMLGRSVQRLGSLTDGWE